MEEGNSFMAFCLLWEKQRMHTDRKQQHKTTTKGAIIKVIAQYFHKKMKLLRKTRWNKCFSQNFLKTFFFNLVSPIFSNSGLSLSFLSFSDSFPLNNAFLKKSIPKDAKKNAATWICYILSLSAIHCLFCPDLWAPSCLLLLSGQEVQQLLACPSAPAISLNYDPHCWASI